MAFQICMILFLLFTFYLTIISSLYLTIMSLFLRIVNLYLSICKEKKVAISIFYLVVKRVIIFLVNCSLHVS